MNMPFLFICDVQVKTFLVHPKYRLFCDLFLGKCWDVGAGFGAWMELCTREGELWCLLLGFTPSLVPFRP